MDLETKGRVPLVGASKTVQLATLVLPGPPMRVPLDPEDPDAGHAIVSGPGQALLFALRDDGAVWSLVLNQPRGPDGRGAEWVRLTDVPGNDSAEYTGDPSGLV